MRISSHLTVIATWRMYSTPLYGTSRMTTTKPWRSPPRKPIYMRNAPGTYKKSLGTGLERGGMRCEVCGSDREVPHTTGHLRIFDRFGRGCFPPGAVGRGDPDRLTGDSRPPHIFVSLFFGTGGRRISPPLHSGSRVLVASAAHLKNKKNF
ncbi:hypothetical protein O3M35_004645 [Rhynocoris fuscipes]|uniref:Uncharacterized protein n=1 Tax=Rhynocoris fuscipes TaxID=488301 RepID=A0AAW1CF06_9HEMI